MDKTLSSSAAVVQVCFPNVRAQVLDNLNRQREEGRLCDLSIQVQGQVFRAHRCVLAASSPYFHDQVLLKNVSTVSLPSVMDPLAFESVLNSAYTGQLSIVRDDIVNYVTVASFLQMWHIVDKCTDILKRSRSLTQASSGVESGNSRHQSPSSSDCCLAETDEQKKPLGGECATLPPLATWRRPQQVPQQGKWGKSRLFLPPQHRAESPPSGELERPCSPEAANEKRNWMRSRLRDNREVDEDDRRRGERWMEADEGVGEESELEDEERRAGGCGSGATLKKEGETGGEGKERGKDQDEGFLPAAQDAQEVLVSAHCSLSARAQWQPAADWPTEQCAKLMEDGDKDVEEVDFGRFAEGGFEGETYDEIEDGTGQVSQRPLLPVSPGNAGGGVDFVLGPSELSWTSGALSSPSVPPSSSPVPSSSSPPSLTPYAGKVHFCHCGKAFTLKSMRDRHVKMQHLNLRPFACPVCAKSFKMKHHLTKHVKTHGALRPYECSFCGKKIIWRDSFLKHQARCQHLASRSACADESGQDETEMEYEGFPGEGQVKMEQAE
ncbi:zinc finger and BTB domain-containing protein 22-like, partial [Silurus asotus]